MEEQKVENELEFKKVNEEGLKKGKNMLMIIVVLDMILSLFSSGVNASLEIAKNKMLAKQLSEQYGGIQVNVAGGGSGTIIFAAVVGIAITAWLAYCLYNGGSVARVIRLVFAFVGIVFGLLQLVGGLLQPLLLISGILVLGINGFIIFALLVSKNVKLVFNK